VPYKAHALFAAAEHAPKIRSCSKMENFAQLLFYGQIQKNSSRIRSLSENYRNFTQSTL